jgi:G3E family GTPase
VTPQQCRDIQGVVSHLNPHARILLSSFATNIPIKKLINTKLFSYERAAEHHEWFQTEWGMSSLTPETIEYNITSTTYQSYGKPFHPLKLFQFYEGKKLLSSSLSNPFQPSSATSTPSLPSSQLLRSKGFVWLPSDMSHYYSLHHTGGSLTLQKKDRWWVVKDKSEWPNSPEFDTEIGQKIEGPDRLKYGDRGNILILIGQHIDSEGWEMVKRELDECLLNDEEMKDMEGNEDNEEWKKKYLDMNQFVMISQEGEPEITEEGEEEEGSDGEDEDDSEGGSTEGVTNKRKNGEIESEVESQVKKKPSN